MHDVTTAIFSGKIKDVVVSNFEFHNVEEVFSTNKNKALVQHSIFSPMYDQHGNVTAMLCALKAKLVKHTDELT